MTTIAFDGEVIAYDSRCVDDDNTIISDNFDKHSEDDGIHYFLAGQARDLEAFKEWQRTGIFTPTGRHHSDIFVVDGDRVLWGEIKEDDCGIDPPDNKTKWAIGSGAPFAIAAMDFGKSAKEAVEYAKTRDVYTGGRVRTFKV